MSHIVFYEKPGCANNARQKQLLEKAGHSLDVRDLLSEAWTHERLLSFFESRPVADWFNKAAPRVKSGSIDPTALEADDALALMLADPILIRRPLMEADDRRTVGFDTAFVEAWVGLEASTARRGDLETCRRSAAGESPARHEDTVQ